MRRILSLSALALSLSGGAAFADRSHGGHGGMHEGGARVVDHRGEARHFEGGHYEGGHYEGRHYEGRHDEGRHFEGGRWEGQRYYGGGYYGGGRRPIYVERPYIRERYFDYYRRPALIVENYAPMDGYTWVPGSWQWDGYEWIWQPGHYQPIAYEYGY
jgi:hypothetical protein